MANFISYSDAQTLMSKIGQKFSSLSAIYTPKGNCSYEALPATPTPSLVGNVYNTTDEFTTDSRFVEGAGVTYPAGSSIVVIDNSTYDAVTPAGSENPSEEGWYELNSEDKYVLSEDTVVDFSKTYYDKTSLIQFDVLSSFIDLNDLEESIDDVSDMIANNFDATKAYGIGDIVTYNGKLYKFKTAHAAGAWDASQVDMVQMTDLLNEMEPDSLTPEQIADLETLLG